MNKIGIASDHAGYEMKEFLVGYLDAMGYEVLDFGTHSPDSVDYADFAHPLAKAIENGELERGIALCGSGEGMTGHPRRPGLGARNRVAHPPPQQCQHHRLPGAFYHQRRSRGNARRIFRSPVRRRTPRTPHRKDGDPLRRSRGCGKIRDKTCGRGLFRARRMPGRAMTGPKHPRRIKEIVCPDCGRTVSTAYCPYCGQRCGTAPLPGHSSREAA